MIKEIRITTIEEVMKLVWDQPLDGNGRYRGNFLYRGLPNIDYKLLTSLQRNCGNKKNVLERKLLDNFAKYTSGEVELDTNNIWQRMILGQHHGLPTRLLDWTHSPLVALNFATIENFADIDKHDCVIWRIDAKSIHSNLPEKFQTIMQNNQAQIFSVDMLSDCTRTLEEYDELTAKNSMVIMEPPSIDPRIINQYAFFSIIPGQVDDIEEFLDMTTDDTIKYVIDKDLKWRIRDFLDEANVSERTIYPGLDGISKWLARHYFVRDIETL